MTGTEGSATTILSADTVSAIQNIFTGAAGQLAGMLQPIMTAGIVIVLGITAFAVGKRLFMKSVH